jgi:hypothetical protein
MLVPVPRLKDLGPMPEGLPTGDEWRVEVDLDDPEHGYRLSERLRSLDLNAEASNRLGRRVTVTRDGSKMFLYAGSEAQAREAERVARDLVEADELSAEITLTRWHPVEEAWKDASVPLPQSEQERLAEYERRETAEEQEAEREGRYDWEARVDLPTLRDTHDLAERLRSEGLDVKRRWKHLLVGAPTEERAAEIGERIEREAPEGTKVHIETTTGIPHPVFVLMESARIPRGPGN